MELLGDECIKMEAIDMWEWKVTRDGQATTGKGGQGETGLLSLSR